ncbi:hypothetical protein COZ97_01495 [bacterium CG_4_8_14_3_um_filter_33_28]|nr:MAG: hypothetical protein COZ97_01495 [bacterium CG_4_8_14_3_um_filter_33_28]
MIVKKRLILYIISFVVFTIIAFFIILSSQGYFFDSKSRSFKKLGMVLIRSVPKNVDIYLDDKFKKNKAPLNISVYPGDHVLRVEKEGYITWEKQFSIKSSIVTWLEYIFLIPKNRSTNSITTDGIKNYAISPDYTKTAFVDLKNNVWSASLKNNEQKKIYTSEQANENVEIQEWSYNSKNLLLKISNGNDKKYKLIINEKVYDLEFPNNISKIEFIANSDNSVFILSDLNLYTVSQNSRTAKEEKILDFNQNQNHVFFIKNNSNEQEIWQSDFDFRVKDKLTTEKDKNIHLFPGEKERFAYTISSDNNLFNLEKGEKQKISSNIKDVIWTKDDKQIVYRTDKEINVYTFESDNPDEPKNRITTRLSGIINDMIWFYDYKHILFRTDKEINFIEIDGDNPITLTDSAGPDKFTATKLGKSLIFIEQKDKFKNIKVMKLVE